ncbi:12772_t:CDS:1, partial [Cetraspora pellucida]
MNQKIIFVFILSVAFYIVNAIPLQKRAPPFQNCPHFNSDLTVSFSPDPIASNQDVIFEIAATIPSDIDNKGVILTSFYKYNAKDPIEDPNEKYFPATSANQSIFQVVPLTAPELPQQYYIQ